MKPKHAVPVLIILANGEVFEGHYLKDINKYERNVNRWRIYRTRKTVEDSAVVAWIYMSDIRKVMESIAARVANPPALPAEATIHYNIDI